MLKLRIYVNNIPLFALFVSANTTLRQLIAKISVKYNELTRARDEILPARLKNFYPVFNNENGEKLFAGNYFTRLDLNACITKTMGLNLKDNDAIYINDDSLNPEYNLSFIYHIGGKWKSFWDRDGIGKEEFVTAAKYGDMVTIEELLTLNLPFNTFVLRAALYAAIEHNQVEAAKLLLFSGAKSDYRHNALVLAITRNYIEMVNLLLIHGAATLNPYSTMEMQRIISAVRSAAMGKCLLANGLFPRRLNSQVYYIQHYVSNFFEAAMQGIYPSSIQKTIIQYALPDVTDPQFDFTSVIKFIEAYYLYLFKPFSDFKNKNDKAIIQSIFNEVDYTLPPQRLKQQLQINLSKLIAIPSAINNAVQTVLLQLGEGAEKPTYPQTTNLESKFEVIERGHNTENIVEYCLHRYDALTLKKNLKTCTYVDTDWIVRALKIEIERARNGLQDEEPISDILLKKKFGAINLAVNLRAKDKALHESIVKNEVNKVKSLIHEGASLNESIFYQYGTTPVHLAIANDHLSLLQFFISENANLNVKDKNNRTPLELAYQKNHAEFILLLIQNGAYQSQFKSLHPMFLAHYVREFFHFILMDIMPKNMPLALIDAMLQYILDENDFENVTDFISQVKQFYRKEFKNDGMTVDTVLPPRAGLTLFEKEGRRAKPGGEICHRLINPPVMPKAHAGPLC